MTILAMYPADEVSVLVALALIAGKPVAITGKIINLPPPAIAQMREGRLMIISMKHLRIPRQATISLRLNIRT